MRIGFTNAGELGHGRVPEVDRLVDGLVGRNGTGVAGVTLPSHRVTEVDVDPVGRVGQYAVDAVVVDMLCEAVDAVLEVDLVVGAVLILRGSCGLDPNLVE